MIECFIRKTFTAIGNKAMAAELTEAAVFDAGMRVWLRKTELDGVFCYTFLKAVGLRCNGDDHRNDKGTAR